MKTPAFEFHKHENPDIRHEAFVCHPNYHVVHCKDCVHKHPKRPLTSPLSLDTLTKGEIFNC
jgi:hypothetical protein